MISYCNVRWSFSLAGRLVGCMDLTSDAQRAVADVLGFAPKIGPEACISVLVAHSPWGIVESLGDSTPTFVGRQL